MDEMEPGGGIGQLSGGGRLRAPPAKKDEGTVQGSKGTVEWFGQWSGGRRKGAPPFTTEVGCTLENDLTNGGGDNLKSKGKITDFFHYTPSFNLDLNLGSTMEREKDGEGACGVTSQATKMKWKELFAKRPKKGKHLNSKFKKKKTSTSKKGAKSTMVEGLGRLMVGTDSSQLEIRKYFCRKAMGTPLGVPTSIDARE